MMPRNNIPRPLYTGAAAAYAPNKALQRRFNLLSRFGDPIKLWAEDKGKLLLPRAICPLGEEDRRTEGVPCAFNVTFKPRSDEQARVVAESTELLLSGESHITEAPTGFGKCHRAGTRVIMYDGSLKKVEALCNGDLLMGVDSKPRVVSGVNSGYGSVYKVTPNNGEPWYCNEEHILSLKRTNDGTPQAGAITNIPLHEYLSKSKTYKHLHKLWRVSVEYPPTGCWEPYITGLYLSDGKKHISTVLFLGSTKRECMEYVVSHCNSRILRYDRGCFHVSLYGRREWAHSLVRKGARHIPKTYLVSSRKERIALLSGILDGDASYAGNCFDLICKDKEYAEQVSFLARSLGYAVSLKNCIKGIKSSGFEGTYHRLVLSGDFSGLECLRHSIATRKMTKDPLVTGFSVGYVGEDFYYGMEVSGDHLYLLRDFTVTHNTVIAMPVIAAVGRKTLIVVNKEDIEYQWIEALGEFLNVPRSRIGSVRGATCSVSGKDVVIGYIQSLCKKDRYPSWVYREFGLMIVDEVHRLGADKFSQLAWMVPAKLRWGLSATPDRRDGKDIVFFSHIGSVRVRTTLMPMIPKVLYQCVPGHLNQIPHRPGRTMHISNILAKDYSRNRMIAEFVSVAYRKGRLLVVFTDTLKHIEVLKDTLISQGIPTGEIGAYVGGLSEKQRGIAKAKAVVLTTYQMCSEATNAPWWDTAVFATPKADVIQIAGRVLREYPDKPTPILFDIVDVSSPVFKGYWKSRQRWYRSLGAEIVRVE